MICNKIKTFIIITSVCSAFTPSYSAAKTETRDKIAILDTGIKTKMKMFDKYMCKSGSVDLTESKDGIDDIIGHGTNIAGIIIKGMNPKKHCLLIIKYYREGENNGNLKRSSEALKIAIKEKAKFVNFSGGGKESDSKEESLIKKLLAAGASVVVAAGNESTDLNLSCNYYPACYGFNDKNFHVVANMNGKERNSSTNYNGTVTDSANGKNVTAAEITLSGTSQATALITSKLVKESK